jgi:hypothetical protein
MRGTTMAVQRRDTLANLKKYGVSLIDKNIVPNTLKAQDIPVTHAIE